MNKRVFSREGIKGKSVIGRSAFTAALLMIFVLAVCLSAQAKSESENVSPIKIGYPMPFSGPAAFFGPAILSGLQLAFDEVNREANGRKIEIIQMDNEGSGEKTITVVKKLVELDKVDILVGIDSTPSLLPVWDYIGSQSIPLVIATCILENQPAPHADIVRYAAKNVFRVRQQEREFNYQFAQWLYKTHGTRNVMTIALDMPPGYWVSEGFQMGITDLGGKAVRELFAPPQTMDFAPYLARLNPDEVDTLWVWHTPSAAVGLVKTFDDYGLKQKVRLVGFDIAPAPVVPEFGSSGVGLMVVDQYFSGIENDLNRRFVESYTKKYNHPPDALGESGYACGQMILKALGKTGGNTERDVMVEGLSKVAAEGLDLPRGKIIFVKNQAYGPMYVSEIKRMGNKLEGVVIHSE